MVLHQAVLWFGSLHHPHLPDFGGLQPDACLQDWTIEVVHVPFHRDDMDLCHHVQVPDAILRRRLL